MIYFNDCRMIYFTAHEKHRSVDFFPLLCNLSLSSNLNLKIAIIVRCSERVRLNNFNTNTLELFLRGNKNRFFHFSFAHNVRWALCWWSSDNRKLEKETECEGEKRETASHSCTNSKDKRALNRLLLFCFVQEKSTPTHMHIRSFSLTSHEHDCDLTKKRQH